MAQHASYTAGNGFTPTDMMQRDADFITPGVLSLSDLAITAGTSGLTVNVAGAAQGSAGGNAWLPGGYRFYNDAQATVTLAAADATNPRIDLIVAGVDTTTSPYTPTVKAITGTAAASPMAPAVPATFAGIILAQVAVAANATTISAGNITDKRTVADVAGTENYAVAANSGNAYLVSIPTITALADGMQISVKFNAASTGAITINLNGYGAKPVLDFFGNAVTNVRANLPANLVYEANGGNFILLGKGGGGSAQPSDVASGKTFTNDAGQQTGTYVPLSINGIIEQYIISAAGNVSAGDFVKFVNSYSSDTNLNPSAYSATTIAAIALSANMVFIAHSSGASSYLFSMICTISGTTVTAGADTQLSATPNRSNYLAITGLSTSSVFIAHTGDASGNSLYGIVCTISGTTITAGTDTQLSSASVSGYKIGVTTVDANKVFIAHSSGTSYYLFGMVCTISGTAITPGADTQLSNSNNPAEYGVVPVALTTTSVFIAHGNSSNGYTVAGMVCDISGAAITPGADTQLGSTNTNIANVCAVKLTATTAFVAYGYSGNGNTFAVACVISGTTITAGAETNLSISNNLSSNTPICAICLSPSQVLIVTIWNNAVYSEICKISGTVITPGSLISQTPGGTLQVLAAVDTLFSNYILILHGKSVSSTYQLFDLLLKTQIQDISDSTDQVGAVALESGAPGSTINVTRVNV